MDNRHVTHLVLIGRFSYDLGKFNTIFSIPAFSYDHAEKLKQEYSQNEFINDILKLSVSIVESR